MADFFFSPHASLSLALFPLSGLSLTLVLSHPYTTSSLRLKSLLHNFLWKTSHKAETSGVMLGILTQKWNIKLKHELSLFPLTIKK